MKQVKLGFRQKRVSVIVMICFLQLSFLWNSNAQAISIRQTDKTVKEVLRVIENIGNVVFFYNNSDVDLKRKVTVQADNEPIEKILDQLFANTQNSYKIDGRQVYIMKKAEKEKKVAQPQKKTIIGQVTDKNGETIIGANVIEKGTTNGTVTNIDGSFKLSVAPKATIQISYIGYLTQEIIIDDKSSYDVLLQEDAKSLNELVVVGYGTMRRGDLTGAISSVRSEDLMKTSSSTLADALQGKIAGVRVNSSSGEPGSGINIEIRGANSINAGSQPLYVIDGVPMDVNESEVATSNIGNSTSGNPLAFLNPADIQSVDILKDASAAAIYGARGANGVILVTTKSGKAGKTNITANLSYGITEITKRIDMIDGQEYANYRYEKAPYSRAWAMDTDGDGILDSPKNVSHLPSHNWQDELFRQGAVSKVNLSMQGGRDNTTYTASLGYEKIDALVKNNDFTSYSGRVRLDHQVSDKVKVGANMLWGKTLNKGVASSGGGAGSWDGLIQEIYTYRPVLIYDESSEDEPVSLMSQIMESHRETDFNRIVGNAFFEYNIMKELRLRVQGGGTTTSSKLTEFYGSNTTWGRVPNGRASLRHTQTNSFFQTSTLNYNKTLAKGHHINGVAGFETNTYKWETFFSRAENFEDQSTGPYDMTKALITHPTVTNITETNRMSFFGRLNYTLRNRYVFTGTLRADGSSNLGRGNRFGYFPSVAFAWRAFNESFMKNQDLFSDLRLRLSYGVTGNDRITPYQSLAQLSPVYYASNGNPVYGVAPTTSDNPFLKWETTKQYNLGIDVAVLDSRISLNAEAYYKKTTGMLLNSEIAGQTGFIRQWQNIGDMENKGLEFTLNTINMDTRNFQWNSTFNIYFNRNKVLSLGGTADIPVIFGDGYLRDVGIVKEGQPLGTAFGYVWDGIYQIKDFSWQNDSDPRIPHDDRNYVLKEGIPTLTGAATIPGVFKYKDLDGNNEINADDRRIISNSNPKFAGGLANEFTYRDFTLHMFFEGVYGNDIFNAFPTRVEAGQGANEYNLTRAYWENRWTPEKPSNRYASITSNNTDQYISTYYVEDGSYLRFRTLSLSYNFRPKVLKALRTNSLRVYASIDNLYVWTNYSGLDPDVRSSNNLLPGYDRLAYPRARTYLFGIDMTF
ncbi:TonB-dependent receptor [Proteiniphilum sp. UBA5384]|uniref:TonB-dependent receptor n=1 Tax=Proteiniphilum sp. UBA5384 TaxID=1947279 RepID=UPI0025D16855|nr:TonB-dependent receptor [Proteiniphilum sp. UBA5384]